VCCVLLLLVACCVLLVAWEMGLLLLHVAFAGVC